MKEIIMGYLKDKNKDALERYFNRPDEREFYLGYIDAIAEIKAYIERAYATFEQPAAPKKIICNEPRGWDILERVFCILNGEDFEKFAIDKYGVFEKEGCIEYTTEYEDYAIYYTCSQDYIYITQFSVVQRY